MSSVMDDMRGTVCLPPSPSERPARLVLPEGAWDCHFHVIGRPVETYYHPQRSYDPHPVTAGDFIAVLDTVGLRHGLAIQVSTHGSDNSYMEQALLAHPDRLAGVAVVDPDAPDRELARLKAANVVGARALDAGGGIGMDDLERLDARCVEMGWTLQICVTAARFVDLRPRLLKLRAPLVIDHMGLFDPARGVSDTGFRAILDVMRGGNAWLKLSGAFRMSGQSAPYRDIWPFIEALIAEHADRLLWGSDWPYVRITDPAGMPRYADLLDMLALLNFDDALIKAILRDNPARIFGSGLTRA